MPNGDFTAVIAGINPSRWLRSRKRCRARRDAGNPSAETRSYGSQSFQDLWHGAEAWNSTCVFRDMAELKAMLIETLPRIGPQAGISWASSWVRRTICALHGHDLMLHFERGRRVCLRCADCGHETPGWQTK
jgi:hypothetical protein